MTIRPEDMRDHLARQSGGGAALRPEAKAAPAAPQGDGPCAALAPALGGEALEALLRSIAASYFSLRIGLALLAFAMPLLLWALVGDGLDSISAYYYRADDEAGLLGRAPRDVFVGVLCAIGAFLWLYKGYRTSENFALNLAGLAAVSIALFPTDPDGQAPPSTIGTIHQAAALGYFAAIAYVCFFEAKTTLELLGNRALERMYRAAYNLLGAAMVLLPGAVLLVYTVHELEARFGGRTFWLEFVAIYVFAAFWLVKSLEIRTIQRGKPAA